MKGRYSSEQKAKIVREAKSGKVTAVCKKYKISLPTYYNWKKKMGGSPPKKGKLSKSRLTLQKARTPNLKKENKQLKTMLAETMLDNQALKALLRKYTKTRS